MATNGNANVHTAKARKSVTREIYNVLKSATEQNLIEWERTLDPGPDGKPNNTEFVTIDVVQGNQFTLTQVDTEMAAHRGSDGKVETPVWELRHGDTLKLTLNLKQQTLARFIVEQIDGTAERQLMEEANNLAFAIAADLGINVDSNDDEDESE